MATAKDNASFRTFYAWAEKRGAMGSHTLWRMDGPERTDVAEVRCFVDGADGDVKLALIYKYGHGFMVYAHEQSPSGTGRATWTTW